MTRLMTTMMLPLLNDLRKDAKKFNFIYFFITNHIRQFDPAITRKGRIDMMLPIGPPDRLDRYRMFEKVIGDLKKEYIEDGLKIEDCENYGTRGFKRSIDLNTLSTVSQRLGYGDIDTVCKRVVEEQASLYTTDKETEPKQIPVRINTFQFLRWINKQRYSNKDLQEEVDQFYEDYDLYSRGSSPNTELNQIQQNVGLEFESIVINDDILTDFDIGLRESHYLFQMINLNETNTFRTEKIEINLYLSKTQILQKTITGDFVVPPGQPLEKDFKLEEFKVINSKKSKIGPKSIPDKKKIRIEYNFKGRFLLDGISSDVLKSTELEGELFITNLAYSHTITK